MIVTQLLKYVGPVGNCVRQCIQRSTFSTCRSTVTSQISILATRQLSISKSCWKADAITDEPIKFTTSRAGKQDSISTFEPPVQKSDDELVVYLRGLPFQITDQDVHKFLGENVKLTSKISRVFNRYGLDTGTAFVEVASVEDLDQVLSRHKQYIGNRYIEVMLSSKSLMMRNSSTAGGHEAPMLDTESSIIRLIGLPYDCTKQDIQDLLKDINILPDGIILPTSNDGTNFGTAFVQLTSKDMFIKARQLSMRQIKNRIVDIVRCTVQEKELIKEQGMSRYLRLAGIPFSATAADICEFLRPLVPKSTTIRFQPKNGLPAGHADVEFHSQGEALEALKKDHQYMDKRFIRVYLYQNDDTASAQDQASQ